jgi:hypothetical protein
MSKWALRNGGTSVAHVFTRLLLLRGLEDSDEIVRWGMLFFARWRLPKSRGSLVPLPVVAYGDSAAYPVQGLSQHVGLELPGAQPVAAPVAFPVGKKVLSQAVDLNCAFQRR